MVDQADIEKAYWDTMMYGTAYVTVEWPKNENEDEEVKESTLTRKIIKALKAEGGFWFKVHGGPYQQAGIPDIIGTRDGIFYALEVKLPNRPHPLTRLQEETLRRIHDSGGVAAVVETVEEALLLCSLTKEQAREHGLDSLVAGEE